MNWTNNIPSRKKRYKILNAQDIDVIDLVLELRDGKLISSISGDGKAFSEEVPSHQANAALHYWVNPNRPILPQSSCNRKKNPTVRSRNHNPPSGINQRFTC